MSSPWALYSVFSGVAGGWTGTSVGGMTGVGSVALLGGAMRGMVRVTFGDSITPSRRLDGASGKGASGRGASGTFWGREGAVCAHASGGRSSKAACRVTSIARVRPGAQEKRAGLAAGGAGPSSARVSKHAFTFSSSVTGTKRRPGMPVPSWRLPVHRSPDFPSTRRFSALVAQWRRRPSAMARARRGALRAPSVWWIEAWAARLFIVFNITPITTLTAIWHQHCIHSWDSNREPTWQAY